MAAALLGFSVSVGGFAWYTGALALDRDDMAALIPPSREVPPCSVISSAFASCRAAYTDARIIEQ